MEKTATLTIDDKSYTLPIIVGSEGELALDIRRLRGESGYITYDEGYGNTGSCQSNVTYIDGEKGILRHRGYQVEDLASACKFTEVAYLTIYGELPTLVQMKEFRQRLTRNANIQTGMHAHFDGFPSNSHPMAILSAMLNALGCYYPALTTNDREQDLEYFDEAAAILISKVRSLAAMSYRMANGLPFNYARPDLPYTDNFLHMMFSEPYADYTPEGAVSEALDLFFLLHSDHEQNCSTSTVRMVASGGANLFTSVAAGVSALWGPLHGGANMAVIQMLENIHASGDDGMKFIEDAKAGRSKLMGFGHRVYKNYDPRAKILGQAAEKLLRGLGYKDPLLDIARRLEAEALNDDYFVSRKLYPNVDFYSGIILRAIGIPVNMFTVMFAIGRMPGWIAHWREIATGGGRIHRPRQIYTGETLRPFVSIGDR